jgi:hypothetical protein
MKGWTASAPRYRDEVHKSYGAFDESVNVHFLRAEHLGHEGAYTGPPSGRVKAVRG